MQFNHLKIYYHQNQEKNILQFLEFKVKKVSKAIKEILEKEAQKDHRGQKETRVDLDHKENVESLEKV
jgi:hypothetical protein